MFHRMMNYGEMEAKPQKALTKDIIRKNLPKFKRHDDLIIIQEQAWEDFKKSLPLPVTSAENSPFSIDEDELASLVCQTVQKPACRRLAVERRVKKDDYRRPDIRLILGSNSIVKHKDNHIFYQFDVTKCMFSFGNVHEKLRMAALDCSREIVVDLFAGIGYFTLPLLVHSKAKHLYACDWNLDAIKALEENLILNKIESDRYTVIHGDNRLTRPTNVAQRVLLGILPSSLEYMKTALECVDKNSGAVLHCHDLVETKIKDKNGSDNATEDKNNTSINNNSPASTHKTNSTDSHSILNHSITSSSTSSHSTIEKLLSPLEDMKFQSSESDKGDSSISSRLAGNNLIDSDSTHLNNCEAGGSHDNYLADHQQEPYSPVNKKHDSRECIDIDEAPLVDDEAKTAFESRANLLLERIKDDLDRYHLRAELLHVEAVKSYAPHVIHVVFDIEVRPKKD